MTKKTLNRDEIMELLPHRDPFLHIDRIVDYDLGVSIIAEKDINLTQDFFRQLNGLSWCRDLPNVDSLKKGDPICSIMIEANSIKSVKLSLLKAKFSIEDLLRKI